MDQPSSTPVREITPGATVAPPPAWVERAPYTIPATANPHFIAGGVCVLLDESQIDLCGSERAWSYRRADLVTASAGAERAAQFSATFDPAFERLEIHNITVIRAGQRIEHAERAAFEALRREANMERLQFDGRITVHVTLPDVRPGDVVESSYTTFGMRKSLAGRHSAFINLEWPTGIVEVRVRQRSPVNRVIAERGYCNAPAGEQTEADGVIDRRWRTIDRKGVRLEQLAPPWVLQHAALQLSEWRDWSEVAAAFTPLYDDQVALPPDVEAEITRIAAAEPTAEGRAAAILRFTQNAIRYLAISIGEGGYTPRTLDAIGTTRYGDCKDKSKLYAAMARRLGIDACPALVNTRDGFVLNTWLPSAQVFDHCVVRVSIGERIYWLDPTRALQPSPLGKLNECHFGWALPLRPDVSTLEYMPPPTPAHTLETHESVTLGDSPDHAVRYEYRTISRRGRAEWMRDMIAREGAVGVFRLYAEDIGRRYARTTPMRQEIVSDSPEANEVTSLEVYEILGGFTLPTPNQAQFSTHDLTMRAQLAPLDAGTMKHPIYLGQVGQVTRRVVIETPYDIPFSGWSRAVEASTLKFKSEFKEEAPRRFVLEQSLDFQALTLPPAEADKYRAVIAELDQSDVVIGGALDKKGAFVGTRENIENEKFNWWWFHAAWIAIVLLSWTVKYFESQ
jgi:hypothetical protein